MGSTSLLNFTRRLQRRVRGNFGHLFACICAAMLMVMAPHHLLAGAAVETNDLLEFEYQQVGANEEEAVRLACIRAVHATIGRLLFSDYSLQARELLEPYIQKNWPKFVASHYVLERRFDRDAFGTRIRVQTFPEVLNRDLRQKRFLYQPRPEPYHYVFLAQTMNGQFVDLDLARRSVIETVVREGGKVYESGIEVPPNNSDVMGDAGRFQAAREAAQRIGAELFVAGRADTTKVEEKEVFYSLMHTYETKVHLDLVRADDGTVLGSADAVARASDQTADTSRDDSIRNAVQDAIAQLMEKTRGIWRATVLEKAKFSLMFTDVTPDEAQTLARYLEKTLGAHSLARMKSYYGGVAVISLDTERQFAALERALQGFQTFDLRISDHQGQRITVDVKH